MVSLTRINPQDSWNYDDVVEVLPSTGVLHYARLILPIRKAVRKLDPDVCHGHYLTAAGFYCSVSGARNKIVSAWGSDLYKDCQVWSKRQCVKWAMNHSKVVLADSDHLVNECRKLAPHSDVRKIIFGIDTELFRPKPIKHDQFRFLSLRATAPIYNPLVIVQAFLKAHLDAELWMYRPSAESFDVMDFVNSDEYLKSHVVWLDKRPYDQMPELYNQVDIGISITDWDSSSTSVNESLSCGVPVIASDILQNREWVDFKNGYLVLGHKSPECVAEAMKLMQKEIDPEYGKNARQKIVKDADWNTEMQKAERIYKELKDENR